jgi:O-methyltransferase involved in polyketide biosynthesis
LRNLETKREDGIIKDNKSVEIVDSINYDFSKFDSQLNQAIIAIRTKIIDEVVTNFISQNPNATVVSLGTGLSTRFFRVDNGSVNWFGIDLPRVKPVWDNLIGESERFQYLTYSILDFDWIEKIKAITSNKILFVAEGLLLYLSEPEVKQLIIELKTNFSGSEIIFDSIGTFLAKNSQLNPGVSKTNASFKWGIDDLKEIETWDEGIQLVTRWYYSDRYKNRLGLLGLLAYLPLVKQQAKIGRLRFV